MRGGMGRQAQEQLALAIPRMTQEECEMARRPDPTVALLSLQGVAIVSVLARAPHTLTHCDRIVQLHAALSLFS